MKNSILLKAALLTGLMASSPYLFASNCYSDLGRLMATNTAEMGIFDPLVVTTKIPRIGEYKSRNENGYFQSLYEVEMNQFLPLPINRYNEVAKFELESFIKKHGVPLDQAPKIAIMPDNSLKILEGSSFVRMLADMGEKTFPAEIIVWNQLTPNQKHGLKDLILSEPEYEIAQRYGDELTQILGKYQTNSPMSKQEEILFSEYEQKLEHAEHIRNIVKSTLDDMPSKQNIDYEKSFAPTEWEILKREQSLQRNEISDIEATPMISKEEPMQTGSIEIKEDDISETKITSQEREEFMNYYKEYHQKQKEQLAQDEATNTNVSLNTEVVSAEKKLQQELQSKIQYLNNDPLLIAIFVKIEVLQKKYPFEISMDELALYAKDKSLQAAVRIAIKDLKSSSDQYAEELLTEFIILLRQKVQNNENFMLSLANENLDEATQNQKISMAAIKSFNNHLIKIINNTK